jgi:hypothetical protein
VRGLASSPFGRICRGDAWLRSANLWYRPPHAFTKQYAMGSLKRLRISLCDLEACGTQLAANRNCNAAPS